MNDKAPPKGEASRVSFPNWTPETFTLSDLRAQRLAVAFALHPERAALLVAFDIGGAAHG